MTGNLIIDGIVGVTVALGMAWIIWDCAYAIILEWRCRAAFTREQAALTAKGGENAEG